MAGLVQMALGPLVLATANQGKVNELSPLLEAFGFSVTSLADYPEIGGVEETGSTFRENALLKAKAAAMATGCLALADDSGLVVPALDGAPGVYSARFGEELELLPGETIDQRNMRKLLGLLAGKPDARRNAFFQTCIAIVDPAGRQLTARGEWHGLINDVPQGENGFGYDPVFFDPELGKTAAQLTRKEKNVRSHRGKAIANLLKQLPAFLVDYGFVEKGYEIQEPAKGGARIKVRLEPPGKIIDLPRCKTASQLLEKLQLLPETALIARNGELLTPDRRIWPNDELLVRVVSSRG